MEFKKLTKMITVNGKPVEATIRVIVGEEDERPVAPDDFDFGSAKRNEAYAKRFRDGGDLFSAHIRVEASAFGVEGSDSLGACHINCNNMFNSEPFTKDVEQILSMHDMVDNALSELAVNIAERAKELAPYAVGA